MIGYLEQLLLIVGILLLLGVAASRASTRFGVPALALFLLLGMAAGSEGIGGIYFDDAGFARGLGTIALVLILFAGGLDSRWSSLRAVAVPGGLLATVGVVVSALLLGLAAAWMLEVPLLVGLLLGAVVSSTDAAAVFGVLRARSLKLKGRLTPLLELESGINDPMAVFLTITLTSALVSTLPSWFDVLWVLLIQMGVGALGGYAFGVLTVAVINRAKLDYEGLYPVITLSAAFLVYSVTALLGGSGFLAVYVAGLAMGSRNFLHKVNLVQFHDGIAWLMQIVVFLVLGLLVFPSQLWDIAYYGILLALISVFVARPVSVLLSLLLSRQFGFREQLFVSWVGLRGAVPIVLATIPLTENVAHAHTIFNVVFFIVLVSVLLQGTTIRAVARLLGVLAGERVGIVERRVATNMLEILIEPDSPVAGKRVVDLSFPPTALIVLLTRGAESLIPRGGTSIEAGDRLLITSRESDLQELQNIFGLSQSALHSAEGGIAKSPS